jgi:hypothetical protein
VTHESTFNENSEPTSELINVYEGSRLARVEWKAGSDERIIEFKYNKAGDLIEEIDTRSGSTERSLEIAGDSETETLYMAGVPVMITRYEKGKLISEESVTRRRGKNASAQNIQTEAEIKTE